MNKNPASLHSVVFNLLNQNSELKAKEIFEKIKAVYAMGDKDKLRQRIHSYIYEYNQKRNK